MPKIYTRTGDDGTTALIGGTRVGKDSPCIKAFGTVDELNGLIGLATAQGAAAELRPILREIQRDLFELGADLAVDPAAPTNTPSSRIQPRHIERLEKSIDELTLALTPLTHFILPGGSTTASVFHLARAVCRRAERRVVALQRASSPDIQEKYLPFIQYLNRLSDLLFIMARFQNHKDNVAEIRWP